MAAELVTYRTHPSREFVAAVAAVAAAHGNTAAAAWSGVGRDTVNKYRRIIDGPVGRGHTRTTTGACTGCPMCDGVTVVFIGLHVHDERPTGQAWVESAACAGMDTDLFFPHRGDDCRPAKLVCDRCPVREACLEYALVNGERHGVWGGLSERERRRARRARARVLTAVPG